MTEQRIRVNQEQGERQIPVAQQASERSICVGGEPSVLHGIDGVSPIATVTQTEDGAVISITDRDGTTTAEIKNGEQGAQGNPGQAATIAVGSTTTGPAGSNATVINSGTSNAAILDFTIPRGDTGAPGKDGVDGKDGIDGRDGVDGKDGKDGLAATVSVGTVTTGQAGTSASVTNSGTSSAAVFDFSIPRGDTGATGADGYSPTASVSKSGDTATITITDKNGTTSAQISDGTNGNPGADGFSPVATVTKNGNTATISITDKNGTTTASVTEPTKTSDLTNDGSDNTSTYVEADELATVATSGLYSDLSGAPTIPAAQVNSDWNAVSGVAEILNKPTIPAAQVNSDWNSNSGVSQILNKPSLATVATSGSYSDLTNKPTIPTVNNATLTIQKNGTAVQTFTANQSTDATANIAVPTKTSDLTNDGSDNTAQYLETDETAYKTASIPYGECDSTSTSTAFTATVPGITELRDGVCMWLKNGTVTSASGFTINVNNLGAKPVYSNMSAASAEGTLFNVNYTFMFVYDSSRVAGGCWVLNRGYFSDANSVGYQIRTNSSTLPALQTGYRYRLWLTSADGQHYVPINTATGTSTTSTKALNTTTPIDPFGTIVYNATNGKVEAGASLLTGSQWTQFTLDLRYAKYPLTTLTFPDPVYLQCTPQSTGGALINDIVQALPTTEDGKIYIYLGNAYSTVSMELKQNHPVYYFKDGQIRLWSGETVPTLYTTTGQNTDGAVTQKLFSDTVGDVETILQTLNNGGGAQ